MALSPDALNAAWQASIAAERAGDLKQAADGYRTILRAAPGHAPALRRLAGIGRRFGDLPAAARLLERALAGGDAGGALGNKPLSDSRRKRNDW